MEGGKWLLLHHLLGSSPFFLNLNCPYLNSRVLWVLLFPAFPLSCWGRCGWGRGAGSCGVTTWGQPTTYYLLKKLPMLQEWKYIQAPTKTSLKYLFQYFHLCISHCTQEKYINPNNGTQVLSCHLIALPFKNNFRPIPIIIRSISSHKQG